MSPLFITFIKIIARRRFIFSLLILMVEFFAPQAFAEKDIFRSEPRAAQTVPAQQMINTQSEDDEAEPAISATDAALRAQQQVNGKVMNVRKFQDENKTLYGVKMLQKNGRMKTINVDADSGAIVE
jgi:methionine-rich copper-binding protein CopC